jgi:prepilin-type N-terminal cleavage/methylation domain-containing protein/prepilin-type processing-associated H-X9-DG protein
MSAGFEDDPEFNDATPKPRSGRGFTLGELLLVVAIIAVLIALLLPATRSVGPAGRRAQCTNSLKQIAVALHNYEEAHKALPPAYTVDAQGRPLHSWRTLILPYLGGQEALYRTIDLSKPWNDPANAKALGTFLYVYRCPEARGPQNHTTYLAIVASNGCLIPGEPRRLADITDAHKSTLMVIEAGAENAVPWMAPVDANESLVMSLGEKTKLHHAGGTNACFVDGGVRFLNTSTAAPVRRALISIAGNDSNELAKEW